MIPDWHPHASSPWTHDEGGQYGHFVILFWALQLLDLSKMLTRQVKIKLRTSDKLLKTTFETEK